MRRLMLQAITALLGCAALCSSASQDDGGARCPQDDIDNVKKLEEKLSGGARVIFPWMDEFAAATTRWSLLEAPLVDVVVVAGSESDVSETVKFANEWNFPFLAYNGVHGTLTTLGKMDCGIAISMELLSSIEVADDGETAKIGGGTMSKTVTDKLWAAGKQTVTGTCECVSFLGPALGGGHGWLQGHHGLIADQFVSMNVVLADGTSETVDKESDIWWALNGAGHNFVIVTSVTTQVYDIHHRNWAIETITFSGDQVEAVYQAANDNLVRQGEQSVDVVNWSYWLNNPDADPKNPVVVFYILQEGVKAVDPAYTTPFHEIGPLSVEPSAGTYTDLAEWTGVSLSSPPCQKGNGFAHPRFPAYLETYNPAAQQEAYDVFASGAGGTSPFNTSIFMFEGYSMQGVKAIADESTAFAFRGDNILSAPLISYVPSGDATLVDKAHELGDQLRQILREGSGREELHAYVNYAYGDETAEEWYGNEEWRQQRLKELKNKYDPEGRISFYAPIE